MADIINLTLDYHNEIQLNGYQSLYKGDKGDTPVKGVDYFTQEEVEDITQSVKEDVLSSIAIPTKVSELTNDSGYLTAVPSEYATMTQVNDAISSAVADSITSALGGSY